MLVNKRLYRVSKWGESIGEKYNDFINGIWCTDNLDCRNMNIQDAFENSKCISGGIMDESIKECLIFTFLDAVNYDLETDKFIELSFEELLNFCEEVECIQYIKDGVKE